MINSILPNSLTKILIISFLLSQNLTAQVQVIPDNSVGVGTLTPHQSAKLEVHSETQGFLMPRMTAIQREGIVLPSDGLEVYCTDNDVNIRGPWYYDGGLNEWVKLSLPPGGTTGQVLITDNNGNYAWVTLADNDTQLTQEQVQDFIEPMLSGNTETGITVTYDDAGNEIDFVNTAPDQTVTITGTGGTVVTGTYPNFSVGSTPASTNTNIYTDDGTLPTDRNVDMDGNVLNFDGGRIELNDGRNNVLVGDGNASTNTTGSGNAAFGTNILSANTTGLRNVGIGFNTLTSNTTGDYNIGVGFNALRNITTTNNNIALGYESMRNRTGGANNVGIGANTLRDNLVGSNNIAIGQSSMLLSTGGGQNIAMGTSSLRSNTSGIYNIGLGYQTLFRNTTGRYNIAFGSNSMLANTTGVHNVALGSNTLSKNTTGGYNFAGTVNSLLNNTTASHNIGIGYLALQFTTTGGANLGLGTQALRFNTTGIHNIAFGAYSAQQNTTGRYNIAAGQYALRFNKVGHYNVALGYRAGWSALGSGNVFLGKHAGYNEVGSNKLYIDNTSTADPLIYGDFATNLLRVNGTLHATAHIQDSNDALGVNGQVLGRDAGGVVWQDASTLPSGGTNGQILATDGSGAYYWTNDQDTDTNTQLNQEQVQDFIGPMLSGNTESGITVTYDDAGNEIDFVNTAPDQVVSLNAGTGINVTGSYPNYTVSSSAGSDTDWTESTSSVYNLTKNIGIGMNSPPDKLTVVGRINQRFPTASSYSVALGHNAGNINASGVYNVSIGYGAGQQNTGSGNVFIGEEAGQNTPSSSTSGNVLIGKEAGQNLTANPGFGAFGNILIGRYAGKHSIGGFNFYLGQSSGENSDGVNNIFLGLNSGKNNLGSNSVAIGQTCGSNNEGDYNVFMGFQTGINHTTGGYNTLLGSYSNTTTNAGITNSVVLGATGTVNASNKVYFHSNGGEITGDVDYTAPSDARFKENIKEDVPGLDFITRLKPVTYDFNHKEYKAHLVQLLPDSVQSFHLDSLEYNNTKGIGFIAQEVDQVLRDMNIEFSGLHRPDPSNPTSHYTIGYSQFVMPLVKAVQEQQGLIEGQQRIINEQENKNIELQELLESSEGVLSDLIKRIEVLEKG